METVTAKGLKDLLINIINSGDVEYKQTMSDFTPKFDKKYIVYYDTIYTRYSFRKYTRSETGRIEKKEHPLEYLDTHVVIKFDEGHPNIRFRSEVRNEFTTEKRYHFNYKNIKLFSYDKDIEYNDVVYTIMMGNLTYELSLHDGVEIAKKIIENYMIPIEAKHKANIEADKEALKRRLTYFQHDQFV